MLPGKGIAPSLMRNEVEATPPSSSFDESSLEHSARAKYAERFPKRTGNIGKIAERCHDQEKVQRVGTERHAFSDTLDSLNSAGAGYLEKGAGRIQTIRDEQGGCKSPGTHPHLQPAPGTSCLFEATTKDP
jgi:hypothetical protein